VRLTVSAKLGKFVQLRLQELLILQRDHHAPLNISIIVKHNCEATIFGHLFKVNFYIF
jgi:hypothetical protein